MFSVFRFPCCVRDGPTLLALLLAALPGWSTNLLALSHTYTQEKIEFATKHKESGNQLFRQGDLRGAVRMYERVCFFFLHSRHSQSFFSLG